MKVPYVRDGSISDLLAKIYDRKKFLKHHISKLKLANSIILHLLLVMFALHGNTGLKLIYHCLELV